MPAHPLALFAIDRSQRELLLVRLVTPDVGLTEVSVVDLYSRKEKTPDES
jgi:hypothetical protein